MKSIIEVYSDIADQNPKWSSEQERDFIKSCVTKSGKWKNKTRFVNEAFKHNLGLVFSIVQKTAFSKTEDVVQKAVIAMVEALKKYDPTRGMKISTWITNPIRWSVMQHQHTYSKEKPIAEEIASLNNRYNLHLNLVSIDAPVQSGDSDSETFGNLISSSDVHPDYANMRGYSTFDERVRESEIKDGMADLVEKMGKFLNKREVKVVKGLISGKSMAGIAIKMKVTRMRISQIAKCAFEKIRKSAIGKKLRSLV